MDDLEHYATQHEREESLRNALLNTQKQLSEAKHLGDRLIHAAMTSAVEAVLAIPQPRIVKPSPDERTVNPEVALWDLGDWQGAKLTTSYNTDVMRQRVLDFVERAERITNIQRKHHPVRDCTIIFGGDMIEGIFNFPTQVFEIDSTLFMQWANVSDLLVQVVRRALSIYDKVSVVAEWGNHGRVGSKRAAVPRSDNFDRMCYEHARRVLASESRLTWEDCPEDVQRVEIGNYRAIVIHGDEIGRNGWASPSTIVQHVNRWRSGAYDWEFRDCYMHHYHTHAEWPLANGQGAVYQTGSTESDNRYAGVMMASSATPSQRLHFVDPEAGRVTAQYKVWLA